MFGWGLAGEALEPVHQEFDQIFGRVKHVPSYTILNQFACITESELFFSDLDTSNWSEAWTKYAYEQKMEKSIIN